MKNIFFAIALLFLFSCNETIEKQDKNTSQLEEIKMKVEENSKVDTKETTKIIIEEDVQGKEATKILKKSILPKQCNFGNVKIDICEKNGKINIKSNNEFVEEMNLNLDGKVDAFFETDVDGDGFNEFYCISNTGDILAFSSFRNKSFGKINISKKPNSFYKDCNEVKFWAVKDKKLNITFANKNEELFTVRYSLVHGETAYQLVAE